MCLDIYHEYQECGHHRHVRTYTCWQDSWEAYCPCLYFPGVFPFRSIHGKTQSRQVQLGSCSNCEASKKKGERRDYGGFTALQTHGAGASHGTRQVQTPQPSGGHQELRVPGRAHQPGAYRQEPRMSMYSQPSPSDRIYASSRGAYAPTCSPAPRQGARQVGNKLIVDKGVPLPPVGQYKTLEPRRSGTARNSPRRVGSVRDRIDRSYTVSPLTEDERNAPYVEIPSHDEYAGWV
ncbi:hypothetical protein FVEG_01068 [Fusarium verticillioides 7600]|uniref:Uncharacterized protein n=1 Tax=Gibberella moniliformis (strain M3125 / FGSC 7600) TaxID=334819 RepID=W7LPV3_GIBM7|nr:hypothetical protein FVEG_01068 [Fusarium verticillioides 7600]EWG37474.1 hypothetical protein FVEG_01068 [Fusarium verticillioides 7600]